MKKKPSQTSSEKLVVNNLRQSQRLWPTQNDHDTAERLRALTRDLGLTIANGEIVLLEGRWYVTHSGLLRMARRNRCSGIQTEVLPGFSAPVAARWVVKATVFTTPRSKGFVGYGDADPNNVSPLVHGSELRMAETRAVNRALRKAYGIGLCSVEELGAVGVRPHPEPPLVSDNHNGNGQPRLRDRLLLFIRQYQLDDEQVKLYALHFCGTASLRETSREQVQSFLDHLAMLATQGRDKLVAEIQSVHASKPPASDQQNSGAKIKETA